MLIVLGIMALLYLGLLSWMVLKVVSYQVEKTQGDGPPLSLVIAARNEALNLPGLIRSVAKQQYQEGLEIVLVLDRCTDDSVAVAKSLRQEVQSDRIDFRIIEISETPSGWAPKKWALTQGIKAARHECMVFTDADCEPESDWLQSVGELYIRHQASYSVEVGGKDESPKPFPDPIILGLSPYRKLPGLLNALIRFETYYTAVQYMAWAVMGQPYMAVGRNLAYSKSLFQKVGGFERHKGRLSGDDDLLVNSLAEVKPSPEVYLNLYPKGKVISEPETTWKSWIGQKLRHLSAGTGYRSQALLILGFFHGVHAIFYISLTLVLCCTPWTIEALGVYLGRTVLAWFLLALPASKWAFQAPLLWYPLLDLLYFFYNLFMVPASLFHQPKWKGNKHGGSL